MSEIVCSFDIETAGKNVHKNPILQIGAVIMELCESGEIKIHDVFEVCIKMNTDESEKTNEIVKEFAAEIIILPDNKNRTKKIKDLLHKMNIRLRSIGLGERFELRCLQEFWGDKKQLMNEILNNGIGKLEAYGSLYKFLFETRKKFPNIQNISDNSPYDLARISLELQKYGYDSLEWIGGNYNGFGLDVEDFCKGVCFAKKISNDLSLKKEVIDKFVDKYKDLIKSKTKVSCVEHSAVYDAIKIGYNYFFVKNLFSNK
jgi:hypothetical protein